MLGQLRPDNLRLSLIQVFQILWPAWGVTLYLTLEPARHRAEFRSCSSWWLRPLGESRVEFNEVHYKSKLNRWCMYLISVPLVKICNLLHCAHHSLPPFRGVELVHVRLWSFWILLMCIKITYLRPMSAHPTSTVAHMLCYFSRTRGGISEEAPRRMHSGPISTDIDTLDGFCVPEIRLSISKRLCIISRTTLSMGYNL